MKIVSQITFIEHAKPIKLPQLMSLIAYFCMQNDGELQMNSQHQDMLAVVVLHGYPEKISWLIQIFH